MPTSAANREDGVNVAERELRLQLTSQQLDLIFDTFVLQQEQRAVYHGGPFRNPMGFTTESNSIASMMETLSSPTSSSGLPVRCPAFDNLSAFTAEDEARLADIFPSIRLSNHAHHHQRLLKDVQSRQFPHVDLR